MRTQTSHGPRCAGISGVNFSREIGVCLPQQFVRLQRLGGSSCEEGFGSGGVASQWQWRGCRTSGDAVEDFR